ncbi:hypothetical protein ACH4F6_34135 [Streptomyces sp. NPDC017936]|uniref:hypothetical protein n=1 Tax=Streptomyces sp. NPDC017936 TaxID=3365016 RepID=UPI003791CB00
MGLTSVLRVRATGPAAGTTPLALVPGTNMNAAVSLAAVEALAVLGPVVVLDVPGQPGLSYGRRSRLNRMDRCARWLADSLSRAMDGPAWSWVIGLAP